MSHLDIFESNGFRIDQVEEKKESHASAAGQHEIDTNIGDDDKDVVEPATRKRLKLTAVPFSSGIQFNHTDIYDLCSLIDTIREQGSSDISLSSEGGMELSNLIVKNYDYSEASLQLNNSSPMNGLDRINRAKKRIRLPKLIAKYASRACRSAVMIGCALQPQEMRTIVDNLGKIDQPWNCPHGRPTLRHLCSGYAASNA